jgi:cytochrome c oxidase subunit II
VRGARLIPALLALVPAHAAAQDRAKPPMGYLESFGSPGREILGLTWGLLIQSIVVVLVVAALVVAGFFIKARRGVDMSRDQHSVKGPNDHKALPWIYTGLGLTTLSLVDFTVWTIATLAEIRQPAAEPAVTIEVTAHQWWWEVRYASEDPSQVFETANEIHVPVGEPVRFRLTSEDVIHSFWVPALGGKTDLIPGQTNATWLEADTPGVYRGQCAEYCGLQHAHMALRVFAEPPGEFEAWRQEQLEPADAPAAPKAEAGQTAFVRHCAACHTVRGTIAGGETGPDLTHLMDRTTIASAMLPNTVGHLSGWIANPQELKPGTTMPNPGLSGPELEAIRSYLMTLG